MCSETLVKLINLKTEIDKISTCIRSLVQLRGKKLDILDGNFPNPTGNESGTKSSGDVAEINSIKLSTSLDNVTVDEDNVDEFVESPPNESLGPDEGDCMPSYHLAEDVEEESRPLINLGDIDIDIKFFPTADADEAGDNMFPHFGDYPDSETISTSLSNLSELVQTSKKLSRSNSNGKEVISRDAKRPRASRTRAEECIKNLSRRDSENDDDDIGNHEDADFHASSEDESAYSEDDNSSRALPEADVDVGAPLSRKSKNNLNRTQDVIPPSKSTVCSQKFNKRHKLDHETKCEVCDMQYTTKRGLDEHLQSKDHADVVRCRKISDNGVITFSCSKCDHVGFPDLLELLLHRDKVHDRVHKRDHKFTLPFGPTELEIATLRCTICHDKFSDLATLIKHKAVHINKCEVCNISYSTPNELKFHLESGQHEAAIRSRRFDSDGKVTFVCDLCPDQSPFYDLLEFFLHKKNVHWKPTTCQPCNKTYASMRSYDQHILSNVHAKTVGPKALAALERKKKFKCSKCDKIYPAESLLLGHIRAAHNPPAYVCETCGKRCRNLVRLNAHKNAHHRSRMFTPKERAFQCKLCDQRFTSYAGRYRHVQSLHKGIRYRCDLCPNEYAKSCSLKRHKDNAHNLNNDKPPTTKEKATRLQCDICLKTMVKQNLGGHIELFHLQDKSKCPFDCCDVEFATEQEWIQHLEGCTSEKITEASRSSCFFCGALFPTQFLRIVHHLQAHKTFACEICSKEFTRQIILDLHKYSHQESKPHLCPKCGKRFKQGWNLKLHTTTVCGDDDEEKQKMLEKRREQYKSFREKVSFNCDECSVGCTTARNLELHKSQAHCDNLD
ncbi:PR domain zinc finger protein 5 isoform X1 [Folsomia candida]|uniref:PR domain zinc finger protein 5 isoform X1 n=1 Tax=Folsomia candida TaxID=158441 RepID=UPI001604C044|nr:PR domain zinc finger protein 5 isoform X1 [Folsomia candida]